MLTRGSCPSFVRVLLLLLAVSAGLAAVPARADAQSVATKYQRALAREKAARAAKSSTATTLRAVARAYEAIVRAHPRSGYSDNALWQAAGLYIVAFDKSQDRRDRDNAVRMLTWLRREYPTSSLARQVTARIASIEPATPAPRPAARSASAPRAPEPATTPAIRTPAVAPAPAPAAAPTTPAVSSAAAAVTPVTPPVDTPAAPLASTPPPSSAPAASAVRSEALPAPPTPEPATSIRTINYSRLPKGDRLTIELSEEAVYATSRTANPDRVTIDLVNAGFPSDIGERVAALAGTYLTSATITRTSMQATRLVLQVTGTPRYSTFPLYNPFRLVIDMEGEDDVDAVPPPAPLAAKTITTPSPAPTPVPPAATSRGDFSIARQLGLGVARIVIDPGHGGHDPGAQANGVTEASLVLDVALRLEKLLLAQRGFEVVLTRRTDVYIPLEERTAIAKRETADMFISIHANSSPRTATRGIETYILDFASNPQAEEVAARENASSAQTMRLLPELVKAITLNNKIEESRELARQVQGSLVRRLAGPNKAIKDFGVKRAPFVVLIGAEMPSILAEISFITNRSDAALLKQAAHRQRIAQALSEAIVNYRGSLKKVGTVAAN